MISKMKANAVWLGIIAVLTLILLSSSGTKTVHELLISGSDTIIVKSGMDEGFFRSVLNRPKEAIPIGTETITRTDRIFVVYYKVTTTLRAQGTLIKEPAEYRVNVPGTVIKSNADQIADGGAAWIIGDDKDESISHVTRSVRWWLVIFTLIAAGYQGYLQLRRRV